MAYALKFPPDVTDIMMSMRDWRYEMVRAGGKTPSARCLPEPVPAHAYCEPISANMEPGKLYMQRIDFNRSGDWQRPPAATIIVWMGTTKYDSYLRKRVPDGIQVHNFRDVVRANRLFG